MAKVAVHGNLSSNSLPFERGVSKVVPKMKRKTPSELRDEQLKRRSFAVTVDEASEKSNGGTKKPDAFKTPRYIDTRVDEVYPARKSSNRLAMQYIKEKTKNRLASEQIGSQKNSSATYVGEPKSQPLLARTEASTEDGSAKSCTNTGKCSQNTFQTISDISLGIEKSAGSTISKGITNVEALKTLGAHEPPAVSHLPNDFSGKYGDHSSLHSGDFSMEFQIPGHKIPLDLTLKTNIKLLCSSSVKWCHRLMNSCEFNGMTRFTSQVGFGNQKTGSSSTTMASFSESLHSWTFPQSTLPPSVISALTVSAAYGEMDFLLKRQEMWEDSFRNLYYMLRKNKCNIFYVCTPQFVVMFTGTECVGKKKQVCNAYVSQSTRGLRSLLREQDISFSMPLCHSEAEQATAEDLVELLEIEKGRVGQTRRSVPSSDFKDNSPQSLLVFTGNQNVHGLYDFLLNYRSFLSSLIAVDVPVLYSPVLFRNASISVPEVKCKEMKRVSSLSRGSDMEDNGESSKDSSPGICYIIEIKDTILPPWIVSAVCASMGSEQRGFEASFITEPISFGLNVALDTVTTISDTENDTSKESEEDDQTFGIPEAVVSPSLRSASLKGLKYSDNSYTASLLPV